MTDNTTENGHPSILTNMAFWQSATWRDNTTSIYPVSQEDPHLSSYSHKRETLELWKRNPDFDVVVTMGARESLLYGLLCLLTCRPSKQVMTEVFIDDTHGLNPIWRAKTVFYRMIAKRCMGILTNSTEEVGTIAERFRVPTSKLRYVPMHTNILNPHVSDQDDGFVLSAGFTRRDYDCLLRAAPSISAPITIICSTNETFTDTIPENVHVKRDISREAYLDHLARASIVALPLQPTERSTGQVVLLEAMALGKPVVATNMPGVIDHIVHEKNGLIVPAGDPSALAEAIDRLMSSPAERQRMGEKALADIVQGNTVEIHAQNKLKAIAELREASE